MIGKRSCFRFLVSLAAAWLVLAAARTARAGDDPPDAPKQEAQKNPPGAPDGPGAARTLSPETLKNLGQLLDRDWKERPEWAEMAIAILKGEKMRMGMGWWQPAVKRYDWEWLRQRFDANGDGRIQRDEFPDYVPSDYFDRLDRDLDGEIIAADFDWSDQSEYTRQGMLASRLFYLLDKDSNGSISQEEFLEFFVKADRGGAGYLTPEDLRFALVDPDDQAPRKRRSADEPPAAAMLQMLLTGQLGALGAGPKLGDPAPPFTLPKQDGTGTVRLGDSFGKRPVVLVFGSFT